MSGLLIAIGIFSVLSIAASLIVGAIAYWGEHDEDEDASA